MAASAELAVARASFGSAPLSASVTGRLGDASSFSVKQARLRASGAKARADRAPAPRFVHGSRSREASASSSTCRPFAGLHRLSDVPPLLVHTLLLGEDANFFGHQGIDLSELPSAILTNWSRGTSARGASTITQQLAKNLFLSGEKHLGRKLQELALSLLLESTLTKERMLEIYLNVIEWGPGVYGLRPAARVYFHKEPAELSPAQMALLVALVPGPVKYQRSLAAGTPSPGFRPLVDRLLAKLRSVDALTDEQYEAALADDLRVAVPGGAGE